MNPYIEKLKEDLAANPPDYGDTHSILEMLYCCYNECNGFDNNTIQAAFEELYQRMNGIPLREMDKIIDTVCTLCREHEKAGFVEGVKVGVLLQAELTEE